MTQFSFLILFLFFCAKFSSSSPLVPKRKLNKVLSSMDSLAYSDNGDGIDDIDSDDKTNTNPSSDESDESSSPLFVDLIRRKHPYYLIRMDFSFQITRKPNDIKIFQLRNPIESSNSVVYDALLDLGIGGGSLWYKIKSSHSRDSPIDIIRELHILIALRRAEKMDRKVESIIPSVIHNVFTSLSLNERSRFFIMKNIPHDPLLHVHMTEKDIVHYGSRLLDAIDWVHSKGIIHADLKPHNILLNNFPLTLSIIDWGNSEFFDKDSPCNSLQTTSWWRAPEMELGLNWDHWIDMWSIGVIFLNWLLKDISIFKERIVFPSPNNFSSFSCSLEMLKILGITGLQELAIEGNSTYKDLIEANIPIIGWDTIMHETSLLRSTPFSIAIIEIVKKILCYQPHLRLTASEALSEIAGVSQVASDV